MFLSKKATHFCFLMKFKNAQRLLWLCVFLKKIIPNCMWWQRGRSLNSRSKNCPLLA